MRNRTGVGDIASIEDRVRLRDVEGARAAIRARLRKCKAERADFAEASLQASEWYRRLGLYSEALGVLNLGARNQGRRLLERTHDTNSGDGKRLLQAARILNLLGAWE
ncbi:MAG: hypothetical protein AAB425_12895, partial [Bdellovibrionota bacterium]